MQKDITNIFIETPHDKQVMMFSATMNESMKAIAKRLMQNPFEVFINDDKLILHGLKQYFIKLKEDQKNWKVADLLDALQFNQVMIFMRSKERAKALNKILRGNGFPSDCIHGDMEQKDR